MIAIVKEFYAYLVDAKSDICFVRGKRVPFDAKTINAYYGTTNIAADTWTLFAEEEDVDAMTHMLCYIDVVWEMTCAGA